ncbi:MAG: glycoside hydrolase family 43 protein [Paludibacter sp.]
MIRLIKLLTVFLLFNLLCVGQKELYVSTSFHEPANEGLRFIVSKDGYHWDSIPGVWLKPEVGKQKVLRDPSIIQSPDGTFHLVWTCSWKDDYGFGYANSKDLIHWSEEQFIPVMKNEPSTVNVWAPEVYYDTKKAEFVVVWASCVPNRFPNGLEDANNNHRLYYITTKDFKTISKTKLLYDPGFSCIDATIVKRSESDYVMVFKDNSRPKRNLKVAFSKAPEGPYSKASNSFTESFTEGPTVERVGDEYLIYFDEYQKFSFGAIKTKDFIHFQNISNQISIPHGHKHGTIFKASESLIQNLKNTYEAHQKQKKDTSSNAISKMK